MMRKIQPGDTAISQSTIPDTLPVRFLCTIGLNRFGTWIGLNKWKKFGTITDNKYDPKTKTRSFVLNFSEGKNA